MNNRNIKWFILQYADKLCDCVFLVFTESWQYGAPTNVLQHRSNLYPSYTTRTVYSSIDHCYQYATDASRYRGKLSSYRELLQQQRLYNDTPTTMFRQAICWEKINRQLSNMCYHLFSPFWRDKKINMSSGAVSSRSVTLHCGDRVCSRWYKMNHAQHMSKILSKYVLCKD